MKKKAITFLSVLLASLNLLSGEKKIDASSNEKLQETFFDIMMSLPDDNKQQQFASSMATIGVVLSQSDSEADAHKKYVELVDGKTADQIIEISQKMVPQLKSTVSRVNGKTLEDFNKSLGNMLIGVSLNKQRIFSSALAKIMYDAEKKKISESQVAKALDGMTVDEVIAYAKPINAPFPSNESEDFYITPMSKEELKARNIPLAETTEKKEVKEDKVPLSKSLVPKE